MADRRPGRRRSRSRSRSRSRRVRTTRPRTPRTRSRSPRIPLRLKQREDALPPIEQEEPGKKPLPANIIRARVIGTGDDAKYIVTVDGADIEITTPFFCQLCHAQCHAGSIHSHLASKKHTKRTSYEDEWDEGSLVSAGPKPGSTTSTSFVPGGQLHFSAATGSLPYVAGQEPLPTMMPPAIPPPMIFPPPVGPGYQKASDQFTHRQPGNAWENPVTGPPPAQHEPVWRLPQPKVVYLPPPPLPPTTTANNHQMFKQYLETDGKILIENIVLEVLLRHGISPSSISSSSSSQPPTQQFPRVPVPPRPGKPW